MHCLRRKRPLLLVSHGPFRGLANARESMEKVITARKSLSTERRTLTERSDVLDSIRAGRIVRSQFWPALAGCSGIRIWECVLIVLIASIEAGEILLNQKRKRPEIPQTDIFCDPDLVCGAPHVGLFSRN